MTTLTDDRLPEFAFYYPNPVWQHGDWIKNLILFFDGLALLVPDYMRDRPFCSDRAIAEGLKQHNLLTILEPETFIDEKTTQNLASAMLPIIASGALDELAKDNQPFHELSYSRLGYMANAQLADTVYRALAERDLARPSQDGMSIPMRPMVRSLVLVLLAQILRPIGREHGMDLSPTTDVPEVHQALGALLKLPTTPSLGQVI